jgi:acyl-CoA synthetase (AMP-forming)/AMP-acid ligase II
MSFDAFIAYQARLQPGAVAVATPSGSLSFAELDAMVNRFAAALTPLGLSDRAICAVQFGNAVTHWLVVLALARLGVASACANDAAAPFRITDQPGEGGNTFVATDQWVQTVSKCQPAVRPSAARDETSPGRILLSSGTTGVQRRVSLSWQLIDRNTRNALIAYGPVDPGPWLLEPGIDTAMGFTITLAAWATGHAVVFRGGLDLADSLARFAPALVGLVPVQLQHMLDSLPATFAPIESMRILVAGGLLSPALARAARRRLTPDLRIFYAASECGAVTIGDSRLLDHQEGAVGYALPGVTVEIIDEAGQLVRDGRRGEIRIRSDRLGQAYPGDAGATSPVFRDGWFHPGDLGRRLEDGLLLIEGRIDDLMNIGGVKILPGHIEALLRECQGVADVAAFALPDPDRVGQWCLAVVVQAEFDRDLAVENIRRRLPSLPMAYLVFVSAIPRNVMGKVDRAILCGIARTQIGAPPATPH